MKVSLIIPTLDEENTLPHILKRLPKNCVDEIIIVDGRSTDNTVGLAKSMGCKTYIQPNKGYGDALTYGAKKAKGDILIFMDADGSHPPEAIPQLLETIKEGHDIAWGSRYLPRAGSADDTFIRFLGNKFFTFLINKLHGIQVTDSLFVYAAIKRKAFNKIRPQAKNMEFAIEFLIKAKKQGFTLTEIPIHEPKRISGQSKLNAVYHGSKILLAILKQY